MQSWTKPWIRGWILPSSTGLQAIDLIRAYKFVQNNWLLVAVQLVNGASKQHADFPKSTALLLLGEHSAVVDHVNHQCKCIKKTSYCCCLCEESFENLVDNSYLRDPLIMRSRGCKTRMPSSEYDISTSVQCMMLMQGKNRNEQSAAVWKLSQMWKQMAVSAMTASYNSSNVPQLLYSQKRLEIAVIKTDFILWFASMAFSFPLLSTNTANIAVSKQLTKLVFPQVPNLVKFYQLISGSVR